MSQDESDIDNVSGQVAEEDDTTQSSLPQLEHNSAPFVTSPSTQLSSFSRKQAQKRT